jgi:hypothetical protein
MLNVMGMCPSFLGRFLLRLAVLSLKYVQFELSEAGIHFDHPSALTVRVLTLAGF